MRQKSSHQAIHSRSDLISNALRELAMSLLIVEEFESIRNDLKGLLARHEIAARNRTVIFQWSGSKVPAPTINARDWYDFGQASDEELVSFIDAIERDIVYVASLLIRVIDFTILLDKALISH